MEAHKLFSWAEINLWQEYLIVLDWQFKFAHFHVLCSIKANVSSRIKSNFVCVCVCVCVCATLIWTRPWSCSSHSSIDRLVEWPFILFLYLVDPIVFFSYFGIPVDATDQSIRLYFFSMSNFINDPVRHQSFSIPRIKSIPSHKEKKKKKRERTTREGTFRLATSHRDCI